MIAAGFDDCINVRVDPEKDSVQLQDASNSRSVEGVHVSTSNADLAVPVQTRNNKRAMMARRRRLVITGLN